MKIKKISNRWFVFKFFIMMIIITPSLAQAKDNILITANGTEVPISITSSEFIDWKVSTDFENISGLSGDWWLYANTPVGKYYYEAIQQKWVKGNQKVSYQGSLVNLPEFSVFSGTGLPDGAYKIFFGIDTNMDGRKDQDWQFTTSKVNIFTHSQTDEVIEENRLVDFRMNDVYLWYREIPDIDHAEYDSPESLLSHLIYDQGDKWSFIMTAKEFDDFIKGEFIGIGVSLEYAKDNSSFQIVKVTEDSPANKVGIKRGDKILAINNRKIAEIEDLKRVVGERKLGAKVELRVEDLDNNVKDITLYTEVVLIKTVTKKSTFTNDIAPNKKVGYLHFSSFIEPAFDELKDTFTTFKEARITDLILDLRYNGGGRLDVATYLASLIKGNYQQGQIFSQSFNNRGERTFVNYFSDEAEAINIGKLVVITSPSTCSASESVINGLRPFINVTLVGSDTCGKPFGFQPWKFGEKYLFAVSFESLNSLWEGEYYNGINADCEVDDNFKEEIGSSEDILFKEAKYVIYNGKCSNIQSRSKRRTQKPSILNGFFTEISVF